MKRSTGWLVSLLLLEACASHSPAGTSSDSEAPPTLARPADRPTTGTRVQDALAEIRKRRADSGRARPSHEDRGVAEASSPLFRVQGPGPAPRGPDPESGSAASVLGWMAVLAGAGFVISRLWSRCAGARPVLLLVADVQAIAEPLPRPSVEGRSLSPPGTLPSRSISGERAQRPRPPRRMRLGRLEVRPDTAGICGYCKGALPDGPVAVCRSCRTPHHLVCWKEFGRCTLYGCNGTETSPGSA